MPPPSLPVVLDTNVVLDLWIFQDPVVGPLANALASGEVTAWADEETLRELEYVLAYPTFALDEATRRSIATRYRNLVRVAPPRELDSPPSPLPRCRDRDDQKFLELAARVGASWLVSKDKRVLSMADWHGLPFEILSARRAMERLRQAG